MLVPLFNLVTHRPDLIVDHLAGYLKLAQDEVLGMKQQLIRRAIAAAVAIVFAMAFLVLAGVALMLGNMALLQPHVVQTMAASSSIAMLIAVPAVALIAAIIAAIVALKSGADETSTSVADHIQRDIQAFRKVVQAKEQGA